MKRHDAMEKLRAAAMEVSVRGDCEVVTLAYFPGAARNEVVSIGEQASALLLHRIVYLMVFTDRIETIIPLIKMLNRFHCVRTIIQPYMLYHYVPVHPCNFRQLSGNGLLSHALLLVSSAIQCSVIIYATQTLRHLEYIICR